MLLRGGLAGLVATGAMSLVMAAAKVLGLLHEAPPKEITHRAGIRADLLPSQKGHEAFTPAWLAAHAGFGAACGAVYALLRPVIPGNTVIRGLIFGEAVWASNYLGVLPAMGLYPPPEYDSDSRTAVMVVAHAVYGTTLAYLDDR